MFKEILDAIKQLYLKIQCLICCRSKCSLEVGSHRDQHQDEENKEQ